MKCLNCDHKISKSEECRCYFCSNLGCGFCFEYYDGSPVCNECEEEERWLELGRNEYA